MGAKFGHAPARRRRAHPTGQFAGDGFNVHDQFWGGNPGSAEAFGVFQTGQSFFEEPFSPAADDFASRAEPVGDLVVREALLGEEDHLGESDHKIW